MSNAFGINFVIVNDTQQVLNPKIFLGGPWIHLATIVRGFKEYMAFSHKDTNEMYIEEADPKEPGLFKRINDDKEWADLYRFLEDAGILSINGPKNIAKGFL